MSGMSGISGMSKVRMGVVTALVLFIAAMELFATITYREMLPFSPFPMFSYPQRQMRASVMNAYAVDARTGEEFSLMTWRVLRYTFPIDGRVLQWNFERFATNDDPKPAWQGVLRDLVVRYESARERGLHDGPPIRAARLYRETWTLRFDASNRDAPDERVLLAEAGKGGP